MPTHNRYEVPPYQEPLSMFARLAVMTAAIAAFSTLAGAQTPPAGDPISGKAAFADNCNVCHSIEPGDGGNQGPILGGVVGRKMGSVPGFRYSGGMQAKGGVWTPENLNAFLSSPPDFIPGAYMSINVGDAQQRADLIAYLATTKSTSP